jgi:hypothetical protein
VMPDAEERRASLASAGGSIRMLPARTGSRRRDGRARTIHRSVGT